MLAQQLFPMSRYQGTLVPIIAPYPDMETKPQFVMLYETSSWRDDSMTLLDFLRKTNAKGEIIAWLKKKHTESDSSLTLDAFANAYIPQGEKIISADTVSKFNDKYYGQWMALHVPFRKMEDLLIPDVLNKVPTGLKYLACAMHHRGDYWNDNAALREQFMLEAHRDDYIDNVLSMLRATKHLLHLHLTGVMTLDAALPSVMPHPSPTHVHMHQWSSRALTNYHWFCIIVHHGA